MYIRFLTLSSTIIKFYYSSSKDLGLAAGYSNKIKALNNLKIMRKGASVDEEFHYITNAIVKEHSLDHLYYFSMLKKSGMRKRLYYGVALHICQQLTGKIYSLTKCILLYVFDFIFTKS